MKVAMRAKDTNRLSVLKSLMSQTLNASKTSSPITTDLQMLAMIRRTANASRSAGKEFQEAGRQDLADKEESQVRIMEEYAESVETINEEQITESVERVVEKMKSSEVKLQMGDVLNRVLSPDVLGDKPVERGEVARIVKRIIATS